MEHLNKVIKTANIGVCVCKCLRSAFFAVFIIIFSLCFSIYADEIYKIPTISVNPKFTILNSDKIPISPYVIASPSSIKRGQTINQSGYGFTPNSTATLYFYNMTATGNFSTTYLFFNSPMIGAGQVYQGGWFNIKERRIKNKVVNLS